LEALKVAENVRGTALFSGMVQGVGFRFTTRNAARGFAVTGYVRNLFTGEVEVVAEGSKDEILAFFGSVRKAMGRYIEDIAVRWDAATGEYADFHIRH
jgi:acylphosphatase